MALAIIYDTSGSMHDSVRDSTGRHAPKYVIANRALTAVAKQIQTFASNNAGAGAPEGRGRAVRVQRGQRAGGRQVRPV